jgi:PilZ domain
MEKRQHPRTPHQGSVLVQSGQTCEMATYLDLSAGGALLTGGPEIAQGDEVFVVFEASSFQIYRCRAVARRVSEGRVALEFNKTLRFAILDRTLAA